MPWRSRRTESAATMICTTLPVMDTVPAWSVREAGTILGRNPMADPDVHALQEPVDAVVHDAHLAGHVSRHHDALEADRLVGGARARRTTRRAWGSARSCGSTSMAAAVFLDVGHHLGPVGPFHRWARGDDLLPLTS